MDVKPTLLSVVSDDSSLIYLFKNLLVSPGSFRICEISQEMDILGA
jgi:hypothetical protein